MRARTHTHTHTHTHTCVSFKHTRMNPSLLLVTPQARTVMIANISPNTNSVEHTLNTLRYADRVKGEE